MSIATILRPRIIFALALALVMGTAAYGYAASNTVPNSKAGDGTGSVSGYTVSSVAYVLNSDPTKLDTVTFTLDAAATTVKVQLVSGGSWYNASNTSGTTDWVVDVSSASLNVSTVNTLHIVAKS